MVNLDNYLGVTVPKTVLLKNHRLFFVEFSLKLFVVGYVVFAVLSDSSAYTKSYKPDALINVYSQDGEFKKFSQEDRKSNMCDESKNNHYDYKHTEQFTYTDQSCMELGVGERAIKLSDRSLYIPTHVHEIFSHVKLASTAKSTLAECTDAKCARVLGNCPNSQTKYSMSSLNRDDQCLCGCVQDLNSFATGAQAMRVAFAHVPRWPQELEATMKAHGHPQAESLAEINMVTVVRDTDANGDKLEVKRFLPGEDVSLTLEDILKAAGGKTLEDLPNLGDNLLLKEATASAYTAQLKKYPHLRITGAKVTIHISYQSAASGGHETEDLKPDPVCYIDVTVVPQWASFSVLDSLNSNQAGENDSRARSYNGVLITFTVDGAYPIFDLPLFLTFVASAVVYLTIPNMIIVVISKYLLGTLSEIYKKAIVTEIDFMVLFSGQTCRALVGMFAFNTLIEKQKTRASQVMAPMGSLRSLAEGSEMDGHSAVNDQQISTTLQKQESPLQEKMFVASAEHASPPQEQPAAAAGSQKSQEQPEGPKKGGATGRLIKQCLGVCGIGVSHKKIAPKRNSSRTGEPIPSLKWGIMREQIVDLFEEQGGLDKDEYEVLLRVLLKILDTSGDQSVGQENFVESVVNSDMCALQNWAALFDQDRKPKLLERLFDTNAGQRNAFATHEDPKSSEAQATQKRGSELAFADGNAPNANDTGKPDEQEV